MKHKNCLLVMLIALMAVVACAQASIQMKKPNAPKRANWQNEFAPLYGNVASIKMEMGGDSGTFTFNEDGHVSSIVDNKSGEKRCYQYDSLGNQIMESREPDYNVMLMEHEYDSMGNITLTKIGNDVVFRYKYTYDDSGNLIEKISVTVWDDQRTSTEQNLYQYDNNGNLVEERDSDGTKVTYQYDYHKNLIEEQRYRNNELRKRILYRYDSANNVIEKSDYNADGKLEDKEINKYDLAGNLIEKQSYNSDGQIEQRVYMKYDTIGNIIEIGILNDVGTPVNKIASFDITYR